MCGACTVCLKKEFAVSFLKMGYKSQYSTKLKLKHDGKSEYNIDIINNKVVLLVYFTLIYESKEKYEKIIKEAIKI